MTHRKKRKTKRRLFGIFIFAILAIGFYVFATAGSGDDVHMPEATASERLRLEASTATSTAPEDFPCLPLLLPVADLTDTQYLKLVNRDHSINAPVCESRLRPVWPDMPARTSYVPLHETAFAAMRELFTAAGRANVNGLFIASGYRSHAEQSYLYANAADPAYVMPPGHSEHQLGLAADILAGEHTGSMRGSEEARWLSEHAPQFGLILRYPAGKEDITGVPYEPWHFRYVGRVHAWYMGQRQFVLEEYIEYLRTQGSFQVEFDGKTYYVLYQRPENGMIFVPDHLSFWISSTNTGGYVVTAWR